MSRILVTGATGYVGNNLLHYLLQTEHEPLALVRESSQTELIPADVTTYTGDITKKETLDTAFRQADSVVHLAAIIPGHDTSEEGITGVDLETSRKVNVEGTQNIIDKSCEYSIESIVYTSTTRTHPGVSDYDGESPYVQTKMEADSLFIEGDHPFGYTVVHPTYVIGARDYRLKRFSTSFNMVQSNVVLVPPLYIPGKMNIIPMTDVVRSLIRYVEEPKDERAILSGENISIRSFIKEIASLSSRRHVVLPLPGQSYFIPHLMDLCYRFDILPVGGDRVRGKLTRDVAVVPEELENQAPVEQIRWEKEVEKTYDWYDSVGLL